MDKVNRSLPSTRRCVSDGDLLMIMRLGPGVRDDAPGSLWLMADITERLRLRLHAEHDQQALVELLTDEEVASIRDRGVDLVRGRFVIADLETDRLIGTVRFDRNEGLEGLVPAVSRRWGPGPHD